ncbi:MAG TPA: thiamine phosphate synthase [Burkholderiales bacterium]|nr:thiamine phosphate synthase [Burkholderiales bacterium]
MKLSRGLYAITPDDLTRVEQALSSGALCALQYRAKQADARVRRREAERLLARCRAHGVPFIVNDDLELALAVGADGAHLGRDDGELAAARAKLRGRLLGASCYDQPALAEQAVAAGADYVAFGSVFPSPTKPGAVRAPLALFARALGVPKVAIGGITLDNAPAVIGAGADCVAVITDLFSAPDVAARARQYGRLFQHEPA